MEKTIKKVIKKLDLPKKEGAVLSSVALLNRIDFETEFKSKTESISENLTKKISVLEKKIVELKSENEKKIEVEKEKIVEKMILKDMKYLGIKVSKKEEVVEEKEEINSNIQENHENKNHENRNFNHNNHNNFSQRNY